MWGQPSRGAYLAGHINNLSRRHFRKERVHPKRGCAGEDCLGAKQTSYHVQDVIGAYVTAQKNLRANIAMARDLLVAPAPQTICSVWKLG